MTCIYNEGAAGTSLLDGHNVSIKVCVCVCARVLGEVELSIEGRELKGESPVDTHPHIHPPHINSGFFSIYASLTLSTLSHSLSLSFSVEKDLTLFRENII